MVANRIKNEISVLAYAKGAEWYIWMYRDENARDVWRSLGRYASDSHLSFSWHDAAELAEKLRNY